VKRVRLWWQQPDQYHWLSGYLAERGLQRFTRITIAAVTGFFAVVPVVMLFSPHGPGGMIGIPVAIGISVCCVVMAALWAYRWPTPTQSAIFTIGGNICVTAAVLIAGTPLAGLLACTTFAPLAGYVALFGSSRLLVLTLGNAAAATVVAAIRVSLRGDIALAVGHLLAIAIAVLAVPFAAQILLQLLTLDARMSHTDALTGLRNRRGFARSAVELANSAGCCKSFTAVMVDLDGFKRINDNQGHAVGDRILIAVAENLLRASRVNAVVARIGGEEFLIAEVTDDPTAAADTGEAMRAAVAATPWTVTASVGVATMTLLSGDEETVLAAIDHLIDAADAAMYEAKRNGGNRVHYLGATMREPG